MRVHAKGRGGGTMVLDATSACSLLSPILYYRLHYRMRASTACGGHASMLTSWLCGMALQPCMGAMQRGACAPMQSSKPAGSSKAAPRLSVTIMALHGAVTAGNALRTMAPCCCPPCRSGLCWQRSAPAPACGADAERYGGPYERHQDHACMAACSGGHSGCMHACECE